MGILALMLETERRKPIWFTLTGLWHNRDVTLSWSDGILTGTDELALKLINDLATHAEGKLIGGPISSSTHDHLSNPYTAYELCTMLLGTRATFTGYFPPLPDPPDGAIY